MKRLLFLIFLGSTYWAPFTFATPFQVISRNNTPPPLVLTEVPLAVSAPAGANWGVGLASRDADHGTVAMANNKDIVVAFHSVRWKDDADGMPPWDDLPPENEPSWEWGGTMKQVELAYYKYSPTSGGDAWTHIGTKVIGRYPSGAPG